MATSQFFAYPKREQAVFDAFMSACGNGLLVSECQDFSTALAASGYCLRPLKKRRAAKPDKQQLKVAIALLRKWMGGPESYCDLVRLTKKFLKVQRQHATV